MGPEPQRRRGAPGAQPRRRRARRGMHLQISERRPRGAGLPLCRRAFAGTPGLAPARLDGPRRPIRLHRRLCPRPGHRPLSGRHSANAEHGRAGERRGQLRRRRHGRAVGKVG